MMQASDVLRIDYCDDEISNNQVVSLTKNESKADFEIVSLGKKKGFECRRAVFWYLFEWTWCVFLSWYIKRKTLSLIKKMGVVIKRGEESDVLNKMRQNFSPHNIPELHQIRTRAFNFDSPLLQHFVENVANAPALDDVYNATGAFSWNGNIILPKSAAPDIFSRFYLDCPNGQSVRNRYRQVISLYKELGGGKTLSIACGSAQPLIHAVYELSQVGKSNIEVVLTDASQDSLDLAMLRAKEAGVADKFTCKQVHFLQLSKELRGEKFDIIEACGIADYLPEKHAVKLFKFALDSLKPGGSIIVSNMSETRAANLLRNMYNWEIIYRTPEELGRLIKKAGGKNIKVYTEYWGIHPVATATN